MNSNRLHSWINLRLKELLLLSLAGLLLLLWLAILTHDAGDPSLNYAGESAQIHNWVGYVGAFTSDLILLVIGFSAHILLPILLHKLWQLFKSRHSWVLVPLTFGFRCLGLILLLQAVSAILHIQFYQNELLPAGSGGILGQLVGNWLLLKLSVYEVTLLSLLLFLLGFTIFAELKWLTIFEHTGKITLDLVSLGILLIKKTFKHHKIYKKEVAEVQKQQDEAVRDNLMHSLQEQHQTPELDLSKIKLSKFNKNKRTPKGKSQFSAHKSSPQEELDISIRKIDPSFINTQPVFNHAPNETTSEQKSLQNKDLPSLSTNISSTINKEEEENKRDAGDEINLNDLFGFTVSDEEQSLLASNETDQTFSVNELLSTETLPDFEPHIEINELPSVQDLTNLDIEGLDSTSSSDIPPPINKAEEENKRDAGDEISLDDLFGFTVSDEEQSLLTSNDQHIANLEPQELEQNMTNLQQEQNHHLNKGSESLDELPLELLSPNDLANTLPALDLLDKTVSEGTSYSEQTLVAMSRQLEITLKEFGVEVTVVTVSPGPVITRFEILLAPGVKVNRIVLLTKDIARSMAVDAVRIVEVISGKTTVGIEIPNKVRQIVRLSSVLESDDYLNSKSLVTIALGQDIEGLPVIADLAKMPHLLVAGTTGSGKSVGVNAMILSILFKAKPSEVRLIMIDPKMLELSIYEDIPHLLCPVVTDMKEAANALRWAVAEMERRYHLMASCGVRQFAGFNAKIKEAVEAGQPLLDPLFKRTNITDDPPPLEPLPLIVIIVDEFADMMMTVGKKVEELIARIAQKARAAGIHLVLATQRPSVDVITGLIKANIPTRIAFQVSSKIDSRTILDQGGAEQLLGKGDMLYLPPGTGFSMRVHGAFVSDDEVHRIVEAWKLRGQPDYIKSIVVGGLDAGSNGFDDNSAIKEDERDLYESAVEFVIQNNSVSISSIQRKLSIGYNKAATFVEEMERTGLVSAPNNMGRRELLAKSNDID